MRVLTNGRFGCFARKRDDVLAMGLPWSTASSGSA